MRTAKVQSALTKTAADTAARNAADLEHRRRLAAEQVYDKRSRFFSSEFT